MPLPWKKTDRVSSFSRLVAGLHHSPKRAGSLVVETGFPTSLVDLFVKNKDRLKKGSKKRSPPYSPLQTTRPPPPPARCPVSQDGLEVNSASGFEATRCNVEDSAVVNECTSDVCDSFDFVDEIGLKSPGREIQVADSNCDGEQCDVLICKKDRSRSEKIRRKFVKNFVPKKLRDAKKEWKNREREKEREKKKEKVSESNSEIGLSGMKDENLQKISDQEQGFVFGNSQVEVGKVEEIVERDRKVNSGYFWILLFIVLGGLLGGRVLALLCTLGWCLMLKLVMLGRRHDDV